MTKIVKNEMVERVKFVADDGTEFATEYQCKAHEAKITEEIRTAKFDRLFKTEFDDEITDWLQGYGRWYYVTLENNEDLVDFLEIISPSSKKFFDASYFDTSFVKEVCEVLDNGNKFEMLLYEGDSYLTRFNLRCTKEEYYKAEMEKLDDTIKLVEAMRNQIKYIPENEKEDENK